MLNEIDYDCPLYIEGSRQKARMRREIQKIYFIPQILIAALPTHPVTALSLCFHSIHAVQVYL